MFKYQQANWIVYILQCREDKLYTGITTDIRRRFREHAEGVGSKFTRSFPPLAVVYTSVPMSKSNALILEAQIKAMPRDKKLALISDCRTSLKV